MENKKLISGLLLEIAKQSTTVLVEDASLDKEIVEAAKKMGLVIPSPDFAIFKTIWAKVGEVNLNGVRLPQKAVNDGIQTLVGKNLNFEHLGAYNVCGFCLSVKVEDDTIECIQVFYRSLYPDKFDELVEKIKTKEAAVSFEIYNIDVKTKKSIVKELSDGTYELTKIHCSGTGLLLTHPPACPQAKIFKLVANKDNKEINNISEKVFENDLCYASLAVENLNEIKNLENIIKEVNAVENVEVKDSEEKKDEVVINAEAVNSEVKVAEESTETKSVEDAETKVETPVVEAKEEVVAQEVTTVVPKVVVKITSEYREVRTSTFVDGTPSGTEEGKCYRKKVTEYSDGTKDEVEEESVLVQTYSFAEVEEKVNAVKSEKDAEIAILKSEQEKVLQEKDKEIASIKTSLDSKNQEIANLTKVKAEENVNNSTPELTIGNAEVKDNNEIKQRADEINKIIARKHQK